MKEFLFLLKNITLGKSVIRSTLNFRLLQESLKGKILDLGSGGSDRYSSLIPRVQDSVYELFDAKKGNAVDFEINPLPYADDTYHTVLLLNVLEHLFNSGNILKEIVRIKKDDGVLIGYVPFLMWYHKDPHDYFRYTHEALERMLKSAGFTDIKIENIYKGPYTAAFQMIHPTLPKIIRPFFFVPAYVCDILFRKLRSEGAQRYVLGYYFTAK